MKKVKILIFPCGSEIGLEIYRSLKDIYYIELFGASSVSDHGRFIYNKNYEEVPFISHPDFIQKINELTNRIKADFIFPALDDVALKLSDERHSLTAQLLTSEKSTVSICRDKYLTYEFFKDETFCPKFYATPEEVDGYPVFVKPSVGYGSKGAMKIDSRVDLELWLEKQKTVQVICEYLNGEEFTVDCFTDSAGNLRYASCRSRGRIRSGISVYSSLQPLDSNVAQIAETINKKLPMRGAWFFQVKLNAEGKYILMEVAPRIAGTMCLQRAVGVNLPLLTVLDAMRYDVEVFPQCGTAEVDRALYNNFRLPFEFDELYVDFDDTVIIRDKVNINIMMLFYQCINKGIPIYLVTKHEGNIREALSKYKISFDLFDRVYHIAPNEEKSDAISPSKKALFLDDSFSERCKIAKCFNIPVYGVDSVEALINGIV